MPDNALIVDAGKALMGRLLRNDDVEGVTHCALGAGDGTFTDPENPPAPTADQTLLKSEFIRKTAYKSSFLVEDPGGTITVDGVTYAETEDETDVVGIFFRFTDIEAAGQVVKEVGFFGGNVEYVGGVTGPVAENGIYHETQNPDREVLVPGSLYEAASPSWEFRGWLGRVGGESVSLPRGDSSATRAGVASRSARGAEPLLELREALRAKFTAAGPLPALRERRFPVRCCPCVRGTKHLTNGGALLE